MIQPLYGFYDVAKKYPSLKMNLTELLENLADNPEQGTALGNSFYKYGRQSLPNAKASRAELE